MERSHHVAEDLAGEELSRALRSLPARVPPAGLTTSLRVIASRERQRFLERRTLRQALSTWYARLSVGIGDMIRSAALPVTGGAFTAVVLFSTWLVPNYPLHAKSSADVPVLAPPELLGFSDEPGAVLQHTMNRDIMAQSTTVAGPASGDMVVDVLLDDQGRVVDYSIENAAGLGHEAGQWRRLGNLLLFTRFTPATEFGRPTASRVRLPIVSSEIDVKD